MKKLLLLALIFSTLIISCTNKDNPKPDPLTGILLGKDTLTLHVGDVRQLPVSITPSSYDKTTLTWKSSDTTIISITNSGTLTAKKEGSSIVTVSNKTNTISVNALITVIAKIPAIDSLKVGLLAYYPFNNSGDDFSANGNNGIVHDISSAAGRHGIANTAYYFNGSTSYIDVPDNQALRLANTDFAINYWVNLDEYSPLSGSAVLNKNNGPHQNGWDASITGYGNADPGQGNVNYGHAFYNVSGGGDPFAVGKNVIETGKWVMVTTLYSLSKQEISFYINGVLDTTIPNIPTPNVQTSIDLFIGKNSYADPSGQTPAYYLKGKLDDIRIYDRVLSGNDIQRLLNLTN